MHYETLLDEAHKQKVEVYEKAMPKRLKGLYSNNVIWINKQIPSSTEKACVLAEEIGHYHTSVGDILNQKQLTNRKQEVFARSWAYNRLVTLEKIVQAHCCGVSNRYELADYLGVTEFFLDEALKRYKDKYGLTATYQRFTINFEPLFVLELAE